MDTIIATCFISKLPEEMLIRIFGLIKREDLVRASEVCKRWNQIISQSKSLQDTLILFINLGSIADDILESCKFPTRRYQSVSFKGDKWNTTKRRVITRSILNVIASPGNQVKTIEFQEIMFAPEHIQFLSHFKVLRNLTLKNCSLLIEDEKRGQKFDFNELKNLQLLGSTSAFFLNCINVSKLDVFVCESSEKARFVKEFLNQLERCDEITISNYDIYISLKSLKAKFKLSKWNLPCNKQDGIKTIIFIVERDQIGSWYRLQN